MKKVPSFSDSGHRFPLKEPIFYFIANSCWLVLFNFHVYNSTSGMHHTALKNNKDTGQLKLTTT